MTRISAQLPPTVRSTGIIKSLFGAPLAFIILALLIALPLTGCKKHEAPTTPTTTAPVIEPVLPPLPKPTTPLAKTATCVTPQCHTTFKTAPHIHGPIANNACQTCHDQDQGNHHYPLIRQGNAMCTFCHTVSGSKPYQHKALDENRTPATTTSTAENTTTPTTQHANGGCLSCHDPHISKAKFLLAADNVEGTCNKCHQLPLKKFAHEPFKAGQCTLCHQPHQADNKQLLRYGEGPEHCYGCHKDKQQSIATLPHVHKASGQNCETCHAPHATDNAKQLKKPVNDTCLACHKTVQDQLAKAKQVHGALTQGNCASCHDPHASAQPAELKARTDKVCMTCHNAPVKTAEGRTIPGMTAVLASTNLHGPVKTGSCSECHLPHAADQPNLLKKYFPDTFYAKFDINNYALCFSCHDQQLVLKKNTTLTKFRDGDLNLHFMHVNRDDKGRTCKTCHEVHGSDLPHHMAASVPFEGSAWAMPINYTENQNGGTCSPGCHTQKTYDRTHIAPGLPGVTPETTPAGGIK